MKSEDEIDQLRSRLQSQVNQAADGVFDGESLFEQIFEGSPAPVVEEEGAEEVNDFAESLTEEGNLESEDGTVVDLQSGPLDASSFSAKTPTTNIQTGTPEADVINGTDEADLILGLGGADAIAGGDGSDVIIGGEDGSNLTGDAGDDIVVGGGGDDQIEGNAGNDVLAGGGGADQITGGAGSDILAGGEGADQLSGDLGADFLFGGAGEDQLEGGVGSDLLSGGADADELEGGAGADELVGGAGDDELSGGLGDDTLIGGSGADIIRAGGGNDTIISDGLDDVDGGAGTDTIDFSALEEGLVIDLDLNTPGPVNTQEGAILTAPGGDVVVSIDDVENVIGTQGDDLILGNNEINVLRGEGGNDAIHSFGGADTIDGGEGIDTALFSAGPGVIVDLDENGDAIALVNNDEQTPIDTLFNFENINGSVAGDDILSGNDEVNVLNGQGGNDILDGEGGADVLIGGLGDDTIITDGLDTVFGGNLVEADENGLVFEDDGGSDTLDLSNIEGGIVVDLDVNTPVPGPNSQSGILTVDGNTVDVIDFENVIGTEGDDLILGNNEINVLRGEGGNDAIHSFGGADTIDGGEGIDTALFSAGPGVIVDLDENGDAIALVNNEEQTPIDTLFNFENINGSVAGDDILSGNDEVNVLNGQGGDDILDGEGGSDTLIGGAGNDVLITDGIDALIDGGEGIDTVDFSAVEQGAIEAFFDVEFPGAFDGVIVDLDVNSAGAVGTPSQDGAQLDSPPGAVAVAGVVPVENQLVPIIDVENIIGSDFNDGLFGNNEVNVITGEEGNDVIHGFAGDDFLAGDEGIDTVLFAAAPAGVTVDLNDQVSREDFDAIAAGDEDAIFAATGGAGNNVLSGFENVTGSAVGDDNITGDENDNLLAGLGGDDILDGGAGSDTLVGGAGNDTLVSDGIDTLIDGGEGIDTVDFSAVEQGAVEAFFDVEFPGAFDGVIVDLDVNSAGAVGTPSQDGAQLDSPPGAVAVAGVVPVENQLVPIIDVENIIGSDFNDGLFGNNEVNVITGEEGNDVIHGFAGDDFLAGDEGTDTVLFAAAPAGVTVDLNDQVSREDFDAIVAGDLEAVFAASGGAGNNVLSGFENVTGSAVGDDNIIGDENDNLLAGLGGDDILDGGAGSDTLVGGAGDDTFISDGIDTLIDGGEGIDTVNLQAAAAGIVIDLDLNTPPVGNETEDGAILDAPGGAIVTPVIDVENVIGSEFDDLILGNNEVNILRGEGGNDAIHSFAGADILDGGEGIDTALFTAGPGVIVDLDNNGNAVSNFGDQLFNFENVNGSASEGDIISGNAFDNVLNGQGGSDLLFGEGGNDTLLGGDGLVDALLGGNGDDTLDGQAGTDVLFGGNGADTLIGGEGADVLFGGNGADVLDGGSESDTLSGGNGADVLNGGTGDDVLSGGNGADTFVFEFGTGADVVTDFTDNRDFLDVSDFGSFSDLTIAQDGDDTLITFNDTDSVRLEAFNAADLSEDDFIA